MTNSYYEQVMTGILIWCVLLHGLLVWLWFSVDRGSRAHDKRIKRLEDKFAIKQEDWL